MEAQNAPKPKRKYVMTPERHAKLLANLAKARLAPKEKVYRKTPKRYAANIGNLEKANAKVRQQSETLRAGLEGFFPAPEVPPPPIVPPLPPLPGAPPAFIPPSSGADVLDQVTPLIAKRLRKVRAATRREGRRLMRLLTAAISRSQPLGANEAFDLARQLLQCLDGPRVAYEVRRLNQKIAHLLMKMIETRYGAEAQVNGFPLATALEQLQEEARQRAAERAADRPAAAQAGNPAAEAQAQAGRNNSQGSDRPSTEPSNVSLPQLPKTREEFRALVARALDLEGENEVEQSVVRTLADSIWERLHWWDRRAETEAQRLERLLHECAAYPLGGEDDPRHRTYCINTVLNLDDAFICRLDHLNANVRDALRCWIGQRPLILVRRQSTPPAKSPVSATSEQPTRATSGSADPSAA
ncbi:MAG: hypothetical protein ACLQOO_17845 [Terriglobia bacterium]